MTANEIFDVAIKVKEKMCMCYQEMERHCNEKSISKELIKLAAEEIAHKNLILTGKNYLSAISDVFIVKPDRVNDMKNGIRSIKTLINKLQNNSINLYDALNCTIKLEKAFAFCHSQTISEAEDMSFQRLFEILENCDREHVKRLLNIRSILSQQQKRVHMNSSSSYSLKSSL